MSGASRFLIEPLDPGKHRREGFDSGVEVLNQYLKTRARKEMEGRLAVCFVAVPESDPGQIAGFYTLSSTTILAMDLPPDAIRKLPRYPDIPATLLGRLARSLDFKGAGMGDRLMISALKRSAEAAKRVASWAVVTDPKDDKATRFYEAFGFRPLKASRLYLPMKEAAALS